jgi:hypothetical protein
VQLHPLQGGRDVEGAIAFTLRAAEAGYAWTAGIGSLWFPEVKDSSISKVTSYFNLSYAVSGSSRDLGISCKQL